MLQSLHVKNLALMEETEVEFGRGLNILTGETGAGKSLLLGSVNLALGSKFEKDMLRSGAESALVELVFANNSERVLARMQEMDLDTEEDGSIIISRKMQVGKSTYKINGETVTARQVKELAEVLLDIHGQHEHQSLLHKKKHLEILDAYCGEELAEKVALVATEFSKCRKLREQIEAEAMDEAQKAREQALAEFEYREIEEAKLVAGEDENLEQQYRFMVNSKKIMENLSESYQYSGSDSSTGAGAGLSRALRALHSVSGYDERLEQLAQQLSEIENLLGDYNRDVVSYMEDCEFDDADFRRVEERLNAINHLKGKYGNSIEAILAYGEERQAFLQKMNDYDSYMAGLDRELKQCEENLHKACQMVSAIRKENAIMLSGQLKQALVQLNFLSVEFDIAVRPEQHITSNGFDDVEFLISTNPGESIKPLNQVASGGELSRVMLAIKTVLAGRDDIDTLIFDEIDAGISGKTAWKVSEQLHTVGKAHQVICITHLPQIAAMADAHFLIEKNSTGDGGEMSTVTDIRTLADADSMEELARLLGSDALSEAALTNAYEMRKQACSYKEKK